MFSQDNDKSVLDELNDLRKPRYNVKHFKMIKKLKLKAFKP